MNVWVNRLDDLPDETVSGSSLLMRDAYNRVADRWPS
jgi:hypothetical protein